MIKIKIVATLGPVSSSAEQFCYLIRTGEDGLCVTLSHGDYLSQTALMAVN